MVVPSGEMAPGIGTSATAPTLSGNTSSKRATGSGASPVGRCHSITTAIATAAMAPSAMAANVSSTGSRIRSRRSGEAAACDRAAAAISDANVPCASSAAEKAAALPKRSAGSLASDVSTACSTCGGTVSRTVAMGAGFPSSRVQRLLAPSSR